MSDKKHNVDIHIGATVDKNVERSFDHIKNKTVETSDALTKGGKKAKGAQDDLKTSHDKLVPSVGNATGANNRFGRSVGGVARKVTQYARNVGAAARSNKTLHKTLQIAGKGLDSFSNKWTGIGGAVTLGAGANFVVDLQAKYEQLGIQAGRSTEEMQAMKEEVLKTSNLPDIRVDPSQVTAAIDKIVEKTGDLDLAKRNMKNIAMTIRATGAAGSDVGGMIADMQEKFGIKSEAEFLKLLDTLVLQGKAGAFTLQNLSRQGEKVSASYASMGRTGPTAIKEMGALLQMAKKGTGSAEEASTAFSALMRDLVAKQNDLGNLGIELWDAEELAKGNNVARAIPDVLKEIMKATRGNATELQKLFGDESRRAVSQLALEYQKTGKFDMFDKYLNIEGTGKQLQEDSARAANTASAAIQTLKNALQRLADGALTGPIRDLADAMNKLDPETLQKILKTVAYGIGGIGALAIGKKAIGGVSKIYRFFKPKKGPGPGGGPGSPFAPGNVTPVFVTNMADMGGGGYGGMSEKGRKKDRKRQRRIKRLRSRSRMGMIKNFFGSTGRVVSKVAAPVAALSGAVSIGSTLLNSSLSSSEKTKEVSGAVGGIAGGLGGAAAGAAIGTMIVPVIGTAIGGAIGGLIGHFGGAEIGSGIAGLFIDDDKDKKSVGEATKKPIAASKEQQQLQKKLTQTKEQQVKTLQAAAAPGVLYNQQYNNQQQHKKMNKSDSLTFHVTQNITQQSGENSMALSQRIKEELEKLLDDIERKQRLSFADNL